MATKKKNVSRNALVVGNAVLIRTVTHYHTGRVVEVGATFVVLEDAAWIADTGRLSSALNKGEVSEVEPFPGDVTVMIGSVVDATLWTHALPRAVK
jgi:hypothetical protein